VPSDGVGRARGLRCSRIGVADGKIPGVSFLLESETEAIGVATLVPIGTPPLSPLKRNGAVLLVL